MKLFQNMSSSLDFYYLDVSQSSLKIRKSTLMISHVFLIIFIYILVFLTVIDVGLFMVLIHSVNTRIKSINQIKIKDITQCVFLKGIS
jgi:hypothetical protein